ncbi:MAG: rod shape-determining protein [Candidatus Harrisonbacteria bacterium RIFOXYA1_FULL_48_8]|uniref:Cell shape-determining protein MreB n=2 Tax=Candidatus Harrisoniibacteriota TaxID=1817905 RepID=A0A1G1ZU89_9BACT|nr:MAG: Cell shape determining protein, MreB/Mrl family [Parcubacteria group bacterium GW2011_GWA1_48_11b]OGY64878.1 MAG: rod shape-determining protein [Candidatus Harrisonbacteria bacterium RIFCSPHIGHO2_12_FULL_48_16]OGY68061.1 MAG: rod shape-determining protein [Candidatus Harrisonbacteria bacterium RIFOXYA1_FULL_48_8]
MRSPLAIFSKNVGIDLGTANSLIYLAGRGLIVNEPSIAAVNSKTNQVLAIGSEAKKMIGRTPSHINIIRPLVNGVISDFEMAQEMLRHYLKKLGGAQIFYNFQKAVIGVPSNLTEVERKSVEDAVMGVGVVKAFVIEEPLAAALGARLPIDEPVANLVVDIGGGTTEVAIISMGGTVNAKSLKVAGDRLTSDIVQFVRDEFRLAIGEPTAEELKIHIGSVIPQNEKLEMSVRGRDLATGLPREVIVRETHVRAAIIKSLKTILDAVKEVIELSPPELAGDIYKRGLHLCGGSSLLKGMDVFLSRELGVAANIVDDPLTCVVRGTGIAVENLEKYQQVLDNPLRPRDIRI